MNFKSILKGISLGLLVSQVHGAPVSSECEDLNNYFAETYTSVRGCEENANGEIVNLDIHLANPTEADYEKIISLSSLSSLEIYNTDNLDLEGFENLTNLESLILSCKVARYGSAQNKILKKSFNGLKNIKKLSFKGYVIDDDTMEGISTLTNLDELSFLSCYNVDEVNFDPIVNLNNNLKALTIHSHPYRMDIINVIPEQVYSLTHLKNLTVSSNEVSSVSNNIAKLINLESLDLTFNLLTEIPDVLNELPKLKYVSFARNSNLEGKALTNKNLVTCDYSSTLVCKSKNLSCLTVDIPSCTKTSDCTEITNTFTEKNFDITINECIENDHGEVTSLSLEGNNNAAVIETISNYDSIQELTLKEKVEHFNLEALKNISNLSSLTVISPTSKNSSKRFQILKNSLKSLKIKSITFDGIYIDQDLVDDLSTLTTLQTLAFDTCDYVDNVNFTPLKNLTTLETFKYEGHIHTGKSLLFIPQFIYNLTNLKTLVITRNEIDTISRLITRNKGLEYLDLSGNKIKEIPNFLSELENLKSINLKNNTDIKGEALNNKYIESCSYGTRNNVCQTKKLTCLPENENIPYCEDDCGKIKTMILEQNLEFPIGACTNDENGKVVSLNISVDDYGEENVKKMLAYQTVISLTISSATQTTINNIAQSGAIEIITFKDLNVQKLDLKKFKNLEISKLTINGDQSNFVTLQKNSLRYLTKLKTLIIKKGNITQDNITELKYLTALQELTFSDCSFEQSITNFESLKNLTKLTFL